MISRLAHRALLGAGLTLLPLLGAAGAAAQSVVGLTDPIRQQNGVDRHSATQLALDPTTDRVYLAGGFEDPPGAALEGVVVINALDPRAPTVEASPDVGHAAFAAELQDITGVTVNPSKERWYASTGCGNKIKVFRTVTNAPVPPAIGVGQGGGCGGQMDVDTATNRVYLTSKIAGGDRLDIFDDETNTFDHRALGGEVGGSLPLGGISGQPRVNLARERVHLSRHTVDGTDVFGPPPAFAEDPHSPLPGVFIRAVNEATNQLYFQDGTGDLLVVDGDSFDVQDPIKKIGGAGPVCVNTGRDRFYVLDQARKAVKVFDGATNLQQGRFSLRLGGVDFTPVQCVTDSTKDRLYIAGRNAADTETRLFVVEDAADLSLTTTASPDPVAPGRPLTFVLTVANRGPSTALGVTLVDDLPPGVTLRSITSSRGTCQRGTPVTCHLGNLGRGQTARVIIVVLPGSAGTLTNTATVGSSTPDPDTAHNAATTTTTARTPRADLVLTTTPSSSAVAVGQRLTYTLELGNNGPDPATGVRLTDTLPPEVTLVSVRQTQGSCAGATVVKCRLGTLATNARAAVTITVEAGAPGRIVNTATVRANEPDPDSENNTVATMATVTGAPRPPAGADLSITQSASSRSVLRGQRLTLTLEITNRGPGQATAVQLTDTLPSGVKLVSVAHSQGSCTAGGGVTCSLGTLRPGARARVTIAVIPTTAGTLTSTANVTANEPDPRIGNNSAMVVTTVR